MYLFCPACASFRYTARVSGTFELIDASTNGARREEDASKSCDALLTIGSWSLHLLAVNWFTSKSIRYFQFKQLFFVLLMILYFTVQVIISCALDTL